MATLFKEAVGNRIVVQYTILLWMSMCARLCVSNCLPDGLWLYEHIDVHLLSQQDESCQPHVFLYS